MNPITILIASTAMTAVVSAQLQTTLQPVRDNTLYEDPAGATSNGQGTRMFAGRTAGGSIRRGLLAFDVAGSVPAGATVVTATLRLEAVMTIAGARQLRLHRTSADWGEGSSVATGGQGGGASAAPGDATWTHRFRGGAAWTRNGGDFATAASATATATGLGAVTFGTTSALVADVQGWLDVPASSAGWTIVGDEAGTTTAYAFATREEPVATRRPTLTITWNPPAAAVVRVGAGCAGSGATPLNLGTTGLPQVPNPTFDLRLTGGPTGPHAFSAALGLAPVPIPLGNGCSVLIDPSLLVAATSGNASRVLGLPVPNQPALLGVRFAMQGVVLDTTLQQVVTSNALELRLGS
ncbi:MAG: DNRLRE domain-containing protein [Planctomycetes bacterium]|nr:DNRLRE domain-containing protein [Planctomycetota bacterium]